MEVAGLSLAAAGLATLFSTCIDCFELIRTAKAQGRDYEILLTKLDVEKTRLLQWADGVGLLGLDERSRNPLLNDENTVLIIERVLQSIAALWNDSDQLRSRYGLSEGGGPNPDHTSINQIVLSGPRFSGFRISLANFWNRAALRQKRTERLTKAKWAISDRQQFRELVNDLHGFVDSLYEFIPVIPPVRKLLVREDMDRLPNDLGRLRLVEEACSDLGNEWSGAATYRREESESAYQSGARITEWIRGLSTGDEGIDQLSIHRTTHHTEQAEPRQSVTAHSRPARRNMRAVQSDFEDRLIACGIIPDKSLLLREPLQEPRNIQQIREYLVSRPVSLSSQQFRHLDYASDYLNDETILDLLTSFMQQEWTENSVPVHDMRFNNLEPVADDILHAVPDLYWGSEPSKLHSEILQELSGYILPSKRKYSPILPNFVLELASSRAFASRMRYRTYHYGILGARSMIALQLYGRDRLNFDGHAYTLTALYKDGTLRIYATWPRRLLPNLLEGVSPFKHIEYCTVLVAGWVIGSSLQVCREALAALIGAAELTAEWRESLITAANAAQLHTDA
jgi:hypothetical protein